MSRYIFIDKKITEDPIKRGHRLRMTVLDSQDVAQEVFVYQFRAASPVDTDEFIGVASVSDMLELPVDAPASPPEPQLYRTSSIDLIFRNMDLLNRSVSIIEEDIRDLLYNTDNLEAQAASTPVVITGA